MSNNQNNQVYEAAKDMTIDKLHEVLRRTRSEVGGISLEELTDIFFEHYDQAETKVIIDKMVALQVYKYGQRLYE